MFQATWLYDNNVMLRALLAFLEQNIVTLREIRQPSPFIWQVISPVSLVSLPSLVSLVSGLSGL